LEVSSPIIQFIAAKRREIKIYKAAFFFLLRKR